MPVNQQVPGRLRVAADTDVRIQSRLAGSKAPGSLPTTRRSQGVHWPLLCSVSDCSISNPAVRREHAPRDTDEIKNVAADRTPRGGNT